MNSKFDIVISSASKSELSNRKKCRNQTAYDKDTRKLKNNFIFSLFMEAT